MTQARRFASDNMDEEEIHHLAHYLGILSPALGTLGCVQKCFGEGCRHVLQYV